MPHDFEREMTARLDIVVQQLDALATEHRHLNAQVKAVLRPVRRVPRWWESTEAQGLLRGVFLGAASTARSLMASDGGRLFYAYQKKDPSFQ